MSDIFSILTGALLAWQIRRLIGSNCLPPYEGSRNRRLYPPPRIIDPKENAKDKAAEDKDSIEKP